MRYTNPRLLYFTLLYFTAELPLVHQLEDEYASQTVPNSWHSAD